MEALAHFSTLDQERFFRMATTSVAVRHWHQFFLWATGELQAVLPYAVLVCALPDRMGEFTRVERVSTQPASKGEFEEMIEPGTGLVARLVGAWRENGAQPQLLSRAINGNVYARFEQDFLRFGLNNVAAHGVLDHRGNVLAHFTFISVPEPLTARHASLLELIIPYVQAAVSRAARADEVPQTVQVREKLVITAREREILRWVQLGKSNAEIGLQLNISALTVKNHVQKILKKLKVQNRTAAVSRAIASRLIGV